MTRAYHSASSDATGSRCERAWWFRYGEGLSEPRIEWSAIEHYRYDVGSSLWVDPAGKGAPVPTRSRSTALGTAMHSALEGWYSSAPVDWQSTPGKIALSGLHLLPHAERVHEARTEVPIGAVPLPATNDHAPPVALEVDGIRWAGFRDLVVSAPGEFLRMGLDAPDGWALVDYKSSANVDQYALSPVALHSDFAANLYALATCEELHVASVPARWVYFETKAVRRAKAVDAVITAADAAIAVRDASARARKLDAITRREDAAMNTAACKDYGGCPYHVTAGGPCDATRNLGQIVMSHLVPKRHTTMALSPEAQAKFAGFKKSGAAAAPSAPAPDAADAAAPADAPKPRRAGRPAKAAPVADVAPPPVEVAPGERTVTVAGAVGPLRISGAASDVLDALEAIGALG